MSTNEYGQYYRVSLARNCSQLDIWNAIDRVFRASGLDGLPIEIIHGDENISQDENVGHRLQEGAELHIMMKPEQRQSQQNAQPHHSSHHSHHKPKHHGEHHNNAGGDDSNLDQWQSDQDIAMPLPVSNQLAESSLEHDVSDIDAGHSDGRAKQQPAPRANELLNAAGGGNETSSDSNIDAHHHGHHQHHHGHGHHHRHAFEK